MADVSRIVTDREWSDGLRLDTPDAQRCATGPGTIDGLAGHDHLQLRQQRHAQGNRTRPGGALVSARGSNTELAALDRRRLAIIAAHVSRLGTRDLVSLHCGRARRLSCPLADQSLTEQIQQTRPTHVSLVPTQLQSMALRRRTQPPDFLKAVLLGGAPLPVDLIQRAHSAGWPLFTTYGLSEMASQVTTTTHGACADALRTVGCVLPGRELMIADDQIRVRGATLFNGYVQGVRSTSRWTRTVGFIRVI